LGRAAVGCRLAPGFLLSRGVGEVPRAVDFSFLVVGRLWLVTNRGV
jgi:hypothetical protein